MTKSINQNLQPAQSLSFNGGDENITEAHYSKSMKTERPKIVAANMANRCQPLVVISAGWGQNHRSRPKSTIAAIFFF